MNENRSKAMAGNKNGLKYSDDELIESAKPFKHKSDWKKFGTKHYKMASLRREVFIRATAHMTPKANPYGGDYLVYVYEFSDRHAYIGLTFLPKSRHTQHMCRGPVFEHMQVCPEYAYKIVASGITCPQDVTKLEIEWITKYKNEGWTLLNTDDGGCLGTVHQTKWTRQSVVAEAQKYRTKTAWYKGSQFTYGLAKREGWFEEATAHMPRRVLGIGVGLKRSAAAKAKMRAAKLGRPQSAAARQNRSKAIQKWWAGQ